MPSWFDVAPRLGVSYDLFGNARTALKATFGKYMAGQTTGFPARYNPLQLQSDTRTWSDAQRRQHRAGQRNRRRATTPRSVCRSRAIGPIPTSSVSTTSSTPRRCSTKSSVACRSTSATTAAARHNQRLHPEPRLVAVRLHHRQRRQPARRLGASGLQPRPVESGQCSTGSTSTRPTRICVAAPTTASRSGFNARVRGVQFFGGWTIDRVVDVRCDAIESNFARYAGTAVDQRNQQQPAARLPLLRSEPARHAVPARVQDRRLLYPAVVGIQANVAFQSYNGEPLFTRWNIGRDDTLCGQLRRAVPARVSWWSRT